MKNLSVFRALSCARGFSLVEMLMALLVASLLLAALAPVMTKKFTDNVNVSGTGGAVIPKAICIRFNDTDSILEFNDENSGCVVPENTYSASAIIASGGGGGGGAAGLSESSSGFTNLVNTTSTTGTATIFNGATKSILVRIAGGGGGAGGGAYEVKENQTPEKQADCEPFGVFINATNNGGKAVCVAKYNPNDILFPPSAATKYASPPIPAGISVYQANGSDGAGKCENANCCWVPSNFSQLTGLASCEVPVTNTGNTTDVGGMNYSSCHRTVCQWSAANKICANWKPLGASGPTGRLPTKAEADAWINNGKLMDVNGMPSALNWTRKGTAPGQGYGLQICHHSGAPDNAAMHCGAPRNCAGAASNYIYAKDGCYVGYIWTSTPSSNGGHYELHAQGNSIITNYHTAVINNNADSVRCLVEKTNVNTAHAGGGGSSGTFVGIEVPKEVIAKALGLGNARIDTTVGSGGNGGSGASDEGTKAGDGKNGNPSKIAIYGGGGNTYNSGGTLLWSLEVPGGYGGNGANSTGDGERGKSLTNPECKYFNIADQNYNLNKNGHTVFCKDLPKTAYAAGKDGGSGGDGGASVWSDGTSMVYSDGKGGTGETCNVEDPQNVNCNTGESGTPGRIQALHIPAYPGVGGGGGGAGNVIHVVNFSVKKGDLIKVTVGHGGKGGTGFAGGNGNNGNDGGASFIELPNGTKYGVLGGKGGEGGKQGNPVSNTAPIPGVGGKAQGLMSDSGKVSADYYFKGNNGQNALSLPQAFESILTSAGGHGGINPKISGLNTRNETGGSNNNIPCGGLNTEKNITVNDNLTWKGAEECSASDNVPLALTRTLYDNVFDESIIKDFVLGATGGGGGGWAQGKSIPAQNGAAGLGGYVYIYFGEWSSKE